MDIATLKPNAVYNFHMEDFEVPTTGEIVPRKSIPARTFIEPAPKGDLLFIKVMRPDGSTHFIDSQIIVSAEECGVY